MMASWYRLPKSRVRKLPDEATYWDASGPVTVWIHGRGRQPGTVIAGSRDGSEVKDVPEIMIKRKFSKDDPYGATGDYNPRDEMVGTARVRRESLLRKLAKTLREAEGEPEEPPPQEDGEDSIDQQVDRYLADYESEAKSAKTEGRDWRRTVRRLIEAGEDEEEGGDEEAAGDEGDEEATDEPEKMTENDIDVGSFANSVMRLVDNYDSLLEMRNTLLRRAANFLGKNYDPKVVEAFKENLRGEHGIEIGKSPEDVSDEEFPAPAAARAGEGGGGGGGA